MNPPSLKILAVDNEQLLLWALKKAGESRDLSIQTAATPEQALALVDGCHFDLFLIAFDLRDQTNFELLRKIDDSCPYVPIVVMTTCEANSCTLNNAIRSVRRHGAWHLLEKPFRLERLLSFIDLIFRGEGRFRCSMRELAHNFENEKRDELRRPYVFPVDYCYTTIRRGKEVKKSNAAIVTDISDGGLGLLTQSPLENGLVISFGEMLKQQYGVVAWSAPLEKQTFRAGVRLG